jgi:hypothetical protein
MRNSVLLAAGLLIGMGTSASAEFSKVNDQSQFVQLVQGKTLTRPFVRLEVSPQGEISGVGAAWDVTGQWSWQDGYFCRDLYWGGDALGYNCQQVEVRDERIRFTSDRGQGDSAEFTLR